MVMMTFGPLPLARKQGANGCRRIGLYVVDRQNLLPLARNASSMRPLARVCRPYLLGRSAICPHPNLDKDEAPATTIHLRSATPLTLRARPSLPSSATPPIRNTRGRERGGEVSLLLWCPSLTPSHRSPSQRSLITGIELACFLAKWDRREGVQEAAAEKKRSVPVTER